MSRRRFDGWHADDCGGGCDGCGYITWRFRWLPGPCPRRARAFQAMRSERGRRFLPTVEVTW